MSLENQQLPNPIIVVGMPRSGSTLFTRLLNESPNLSIVNDFYYLQYVDSLNGFKKNDPKIQQALQSYVLRMIQERILPPNSQDITFSLFLSPEQEQELVDFAEDLKRQPDVNWAESLSKLMEFSAKLQGKKIWGYNTPQDYLHIDRLQQEFPQAKFIYVMRDPRSVIRSYKYYGNIAPEGQKEAARYHPILQALAWRTSIRSFLARKEQEPDKFTLVLYEDLVKNTNQTLGKLGDFLNVQFPKLDLANFGNNSSFKNKHKEGVKSSEIWLCEKIAGQEMEKIGYELSSKKLVYKDLGYLAYLTNRVFSYYCKNFLISNDIRKRVFKLAKLSISQENY